MRVNCETSASWDLNNCGNEMYLGGHLKTLHWKRVGVIWWMKIILKKLTAPQTRTAHSQYCAFYSISFPTKPLKTLPDELWLQSEYILSILLPFFQSSKNLWRVIYSVLWRICQERVCFAEVNASLMWHFIFLRCAAPLWRRSIRHQISKVCKTVDGGRACNHYLKTQQTKSLRNANGSALWFNYKP